MQYTWEVATTEKKADKNKIYTVSKLKTCLYIHLPYQYKQRLYDTTYTHRN